MNWWRYWCWHTVNFERSYILNDWTLSIKDQGSDNFIQVGKYMVSFRELWANGCGVWTLWCGSERVEWSLPNEDWRRALLGSSQWVTFSTFYLKRGWSWTWEWVELAFEERKTFRIRDRRWKNYCIGMTSWKGIVTRNDQEEETILKRTMKFPHLMAALLSTIPASSSNTGWPARYGEGSLQTWLALLFLTFKLFGLFS